MPQKLHRTLVRSERIIILLTCLVLAVTFFVLQFGGKYTLLFGGFCNGVCLTCYAFIRTVRKWNEGRR